MLQSLGFLVVLLVFSLPEEIRGLLYLLFLLFSPLILLLFVLVIYNQTTKEKGGPKSPDDI